MLHGCYEMMHTPGLWRHVTHLEQFTLVVDDFGVKYVCENKAQYIIDVICNQGYKLEDD